MASIQRIKAHSHFHIFASVLSECLRGNDLEHKLRVFLYNVRMTWKSSQPHQLQFGGSISLFPHQNTCLLSCTSVASVATCTRISACLAGCLSIHSSIHVILSVCVCVLLFISFIYICCQCSVCLSCGILRTVAGCLRLLRRSTWIDCLTETSAISHSTLYPEYALRVSTQTIICKKL